MNSNEKNPSVSIAIPKAKPKMERLSPGVYRNGEGNLVGGQGQKIPGSRPSYQSVVQNLAKPMPNGAAGGPNPNIQRILELMGGGSGAGSQPIPKMPGLSIDPGFEMQPSDVTPELRRLMDGALNAATPQIPRSNSISDILRRA